jgi:hypothetical protein
LAKSLALTIILAILVGGVGHIYLGFIKRGLVILVIGIVLWDICVSSYSVPLHVDNNHRLFGLANNICIYPLQEVDIWANTDPQI